MNTCIMKENALMWVGFWALDLNVSVRCIYLFLQRSEVDWKMKRKHWFSQINYTVLCSSCNLHVEHKVPWLQAVGDTPLAPHLAPWQGLHLLSWQYCAYLACVPQLEMRLVFPYYILILQLFCSTGKINKIVIQKVFALFSLISCLLAQLSHMTTVQLESFLILKGQIIVPL